jgi:hypothetical protein
MALQSSNTILTAEAFLSIRSGAQGWKAQAQNANLTMAAGSVNTNFIFQMLDQLRGCVAALTTWKAVSGLDTYATAQGYVGTMSVDCTATINAANACIAWIVANFPASGGFLQAETLNADGTRTLRAFTSANTAGLQTNLTAFIATIS